MSNVQNLIEKLCPNGVEYKPLKDVCDFNRGKTITAKTAVKGDIPVVAGGRKPAYYHNTSNREGATIVVAGSGAYAGYVSYWEQPIFVSDAFSVDIKNNDELNIKYLYYVLKNMQNQIYNMQSGGGIQHVYGRDLAPILIPVPPISVQEELVEILDKFTTVIDELQKGIELSQKQYEYYRNQLLSDDHQENVEYKPLKDVCDFANGFAFKQSSFNDYGVPVVRITNIVNGLVDLTKTKRIDPSDYQKPLDSFIIKEGDILISMSGSIGKVGYYTHSTPSYLNQRVGKIIPDIEKITPRYLYHWLASKQKEFMSLATNGHISNLSFKVLEPLRIPVPPIPVQEELVEILDKFTTITDELQKAVTLYQKQYEYYRNQLLTFEPFKE